MGARKNKTERELVVEEQQAQCIINHDQNTQLLSFFPQNAHDFESMK